MKFKTSEVVGGIALGLLLSIIRIACIQSNEIKELETQLAEISKPVAAVYTVSIEEISADNTVDPIDVVVETKEAEKKAPYEYISLDDDLQIYLEERCNDLGIDVFFALALMESESNFNCDATGDSGRSVGLFQINQVWWDYMDEHYGLDVNDPRDNIEIGLIIINNLMAKYPDDLIPVVQCYKCGEYRGEELMHEGIYISACRLVLDRAETFRKMKEA